MGLLRLTPAQLYDHTFREFGNAVRGCYKYQEIAQRADWERTRWQTALLLNVHTKKGQHLKPKDLTVFPWEKSTTQQNLKKGWAQLKALATK